MFNLIWWTVTFSYMMIGIVTIDTTDVLYVIACCNAFYAFVDIVLSFADCATCTYGWFYNWATKTTRRWQIFTFGILGRLVTIIFTMVFVKDAGQIYAFKVGFNMVIVHFIVMIGVFFIAGTIRKIINTHICVN